MTRRWTAQELLDLVLDEGSYESWDQPIDISDAAPGYRAELEAARAKAGTDESVLTGRGLVHGRPVAVLANEFRFLAGSIGLAAARRITSAIRRATAEGIPVRAVAPGRGGRDRRRDRPLPGQPRHDDRADRLGGARSGLRRGSVGAAPGQRVIVAEKAWLMPLPPEGASVIVHGDTSHADEQARSMRVRAVDLLAQGTAHQVVPEPDDDTGDGLAEAMAAEIGAAIRSLRYGTAAPDA